jgi:CMP/dCMP kinase
MAGSAARRVCRARAAVDCGRALMIVAIDGPAGSGKSTVARMLAQRLGFSYLDSGAMYRCVALAAIERFGAAGLNERLQDSGAGSGAGVGAAIGALAGELRIELGERVLLGGLDVSERIRSTEVSEAASAVAAIQDVRSALVRMQRALLATGDWVAEGRDVGTIVAPAAQLKVYLTATPAERARRRAAQLGADLRTVLAEQAIRDARDEGREHSPLRAAADAIGLDTTQMSLEEVVDRLAALASQAGR